MRTWPSVVKIDPWLKNKKSSKVHIGTSILTNTKDIVESFNTHFIRVAKPLVGSQTGNSRNKDVHSSLSKLQNFIH